MKIYEEKTHIILTVYYQLQDRLDDIKIKVNYAGSNIKSMCIRIQCGC